jgi:hypothetical protein
MSQARLNEKHVQENWVDRLQTLRRVLCGDTTWAVGARGSRVREVRTRYKDADGNTRAFIIDYTHDDDSRVQAVRMLRDDDGTQWDVRDVIAADRLVK